MTTYATLLASVQEEAHEPADSSVFARHTKSALYHMRSLVVPWSNATTDIQCVADQKSYEIGVDIPGDILSFNSIFLYYPGTSGGLNVELIRVSFQEYRRLDVSTTSAVGIPTLYSYYDKKLWIWPIPGNTDQYLRIDYQRDSTRDENTGLEFDASSPDTAFTNEYFRRGEEMLRTRVLATYAGTRSQSSAEYAVAIGQYQEARRGVMRERDMMEMDGNQTEAYW